MKRTLLLSAVCATAAISTPASAYEAGWATGGAGTEYHHVRVLIGGYDCNNTLCNQVEQPQYYSVRNISPAPGVAVVDNIKNTDILFDASGNAVIDAITGNNYDGSGNPVPGSGATQFTLMISDAYLPIPASPGLNFPNGSAASPPVFDITTAPNGKIIDGWWHNRTFAAGLDIFSYNSLGDRLNWTLNACTPGLQPDITVPADRALLLALPTDSDGNVASLAGTGCFLQAVNIVNYVTCDTAAECGQFEKSVPVPALATGALALGLAGITFLTGRRRNTK